MNLVIDIGNSSVKIGLFEGENLLSQGTFSVYPRKETDEWGIVLISWLKTCFKHPKVDKVIIASVVPSILLPVKEAICKYLQITPKQLTPKLAGIPILYENPEKLGADRIANAVAAVRMYKLPAVVVDFGTATTFDVISEKGEYVGGVIAPGVQAVCDSLWQRAEKLFPVEFRKPLYVIGKNTYENLTSGVFHSVLGATEYILEMIEREVGKKVNVIATGGWGKIVAPECKKIKKINPNLTLQGLNFVALDLNKR